MYELASATTNTGLSRVEELTAQARFYTNAIKDNAMQLGRVLCEAKELIPHKEWGSWVQENTTMSLRSAEMLMGSYKRFGGRPEYEALQKTQIFKLLGLPEGKQDEFMQEHDVSSMSTRELDKAVKQAREDERKKVEAEKKIVIDQKNGLIDQYRNEKAALQNKINELNNTVPQLPQSVTDEIERLKAMAQQAVSDMNKIQQEKDDQEFLLNQMQKNLDITQEKFLALQSTIQRGDAERKPSDRLDIDSFAQAVRAFTTACCLLPTMNVEFAGMTLAQLNDYDKYLQLVEKWCKDARKAMHSDVVEV